METKEFEDLSEKEKEIFNKLQEYYNNNVFIHLAKHVRELCNEMDKYESDDHINREEKEEPKKESNYKGRKKGAKNLKAKYKLEYEGNTYECKSQQEIANIVGRSRMCISRLVRGETTFRCKERTKDLKKIKITKL